MNQLTVVWHKDAEDELANAWLEAARLKEQNLVTAAADQIEKLLRKRASSRMASTFPRVSGKSIATH